MGEEGAKFTTYIYIRFNHFEFNWKVFWCGWNSDNRNFCGLVKKITAALVCLVSPISICAVIIFGRWWSQRVADKAIPTQTSRKVHERFMKA